MDERFLRTEMLLGAHAMETLAASHVAVFGLGGVGSWCAEALARSGVGALTLVDHDTVGLTNLNRQVEATLSTLGLPKAEAMARRVADINPDCRVTVRVEKYEAENASSKASKQKAGAKSKTAGASSQKEQDLPPVDIGDAYADFCYRIFGLTPKTLTKDSLEQAYSRLCLHYHPNLNSSKDVFEKLFEVQKAYACLRDVLQKRNEAQSNR